MTLLRWAVRQSRSVRGLSGPDTRRVGRRGARFGRRRRFLDAGLPSAGSERLEPDRLATVKIDHGLEHHADPALVQHHSTRAPSNR
jgi:hypothetical protein